MRARRIVEMYERGMARDDHEKLSLRVVDESGVAMGVSLREVQELVELDEYLLRYEAHREKTAAVDEGWMLTDLATTGVILVSLVLDPSGSSDQPPPTGQFL